MNDFAIFYPVFALVFLLFGVYVRLGYLRYRAVSANRELIKYYIDFRGDQEPLEIRIVSRHVLNHFELPLLLHIGAIVAFVSGQVSTLLLVLAWVYVASRYMHSWVHLGSNHVPTRFRVFGASLLVLTLFWIVLLFSLLSLI